MRVMRGLLRDRAGGRHAAAHGRLLARWHAAVLHLRQRADGDPGGDRRRPLRRGAVFPRMVVIIFAGLIHHVGQMVFGAARRRPRTASRGALSAAGHAVARGRDGAAGRLSARAGSTAARRARRRSSLAELQCRASSRGWRAARAWAQSRREFERGPRPQISPSRLHRAEDLPRGRGAACGRPGPGDAGRDRRGGDGGRGSQGPLRLRTGVDGLAFRCLTSSSRCWPRSIPRGRSCRRFPRVPAANWHEREAQDLFGIVFAGHPDPRPLVVHDGWPKGLYPLRKGFDAAAPGRSARRGVPAPGRGGRGRVRGAGGADSRRDHRAGPLPLQHDRRDGAPPRARLFYTHRGLEKRIEGMTTIDALSRARNNDG